MSQADDAAPSSPAPNPPPSPATLAERISAAMQAKTLCWDVTEVAKLSQQGVDKGVILTQVQNSTSVPRLTSDEIIYLHEQGVAPEVSSALIRRGSELSSRPTLVRTSAPLSTALQPVPQVVYLTPPPARVSTAEYYYYERPVVIPYSYRTTWAPYVYWSYPVYPWRTWGNHCYRPTQPAHPIARSVHPSPTPGPIAYRTHTKPAARPIRPRP
jgi:hypothetical protein